MAARAMGWFARVITKNINKNARDDESMLDLKGIWNQEFFVILLYVFLEILILVQLEGS